MSEFRWWRKLRGGHWELVNFDRLWSCFAGLRWMRMPCTRAMFGGNGVGLVCCEERGQIVHANPANGPVPS